MLDARKEVAKDQSQVSEQNERLEQELSILHERIATFNNKLDSILRVSQPSVADKESESPNLVPLADTLYRFLNSTKAARFAIEDLMDRLEL